MKRHVFKYQLAFIIMLFLNISLKAQPDPGPIDGGTGILALIALLFGGVSLWKKNRNK